MSYKKLSAHDKATTANIHKLARLERLENDIVLNSISSSELTLP